MKRLEWLALPFADAKAMAAKLEFDAEEKAKVETALVSLELNDARLTKDQKEGLRKLLAIREEGRLPAREPILANYWRMVAAGAEKQKDAAAFGLYVEYLRTQVEKQPRMKPALDRAEATLAAMRKQ